MENQQSGGTKVVEATCFYCEKGRVAVANLPCACPECGTTLLDLMERMTFEELQAAYVRKYGAQDPTYSLAG